MKLVQSRWYPYFDNYKHVSLFYILLKVSERIIYNLLVEYLEMLNIWNDKQLDLNQWLVQLMYFIVLTD